MSSLTPILYKKRRQTCADGRQTNRGTHVDVVLEVFTAGQRTVTEVVNVRCAYCG